MQTLPFTPPLFTGGAHTHTHVRTIEQFNISIYIYNEIYISHYSNYVDGIIQLNFVDS